MRLFDADTLVPKHFVQRTDKIIGYAGTQPIYEYVDVVAYDIDGAPTVEAIPKEWIQDWQIKHEWEYDSFFRMVNGVPKYAVECMLEDWEKEHDNQERPL